MPDKRQPGPVGPAPARWRDRLPSWLLTAVTLPSVVWASCFLVLAGLAVWSTHDGSETCPAMTVADDASGDAGDADGGSTGQLPKLEPTVDRPATVPLGRARAVRTARTSLTVATVSTEELTQDTSQQPTEGTAGPSAPPTTAALDDVSAVLPLEVRINPFVREDGASLRQSDDAEGPLVTARAFSRRGTVVVELCVDRDGIALGHPGRYEGSVTVVDPAVVATDVPFVVTMAYPNAALVALLTVAAVAVAAVYSWRLRIQRDDDDDRIDFGCFFDWLGTWTGVLAVASGSVAAYVAYAATYLSNVVWGTSVTQYTAILGAVFTAFVTAATTIIAGSQMRGSQGGRDGAPGAAGGRGTAAGTPPPKDG